MALVAGGCGGSGSLGAKALAQQARSLQSVAAEGALLAEDAVAGKTTQIYTREHSSALQGAAAKAEAALESARTEPALAPKLRELAVLAGRIGTALERLAGVSKDQQRALARELEAAAHKSQQIGTGLT